MNAKRPAVREVGILIDGAYRRGGGDVFEVRDPYRGEIVAAVAGADEGDVGQAVDAAGRGQAALAELSAHARAEILERAAALLSAKRDDIAEEITRQVGKALRETRREVERSAATLIASAAAARDARGTWLPADAGPGGEGLLAVEVRVPVGVVAAIVPYNSPLNLTAHKVGPAIAAGNAVVLKPSSAAPLTPFRLAEALLEAGLPPAAISILPGGPAIGEMLVRHPKVRFVTFTGGGQAGAAVARAAGLDKRVTLELGGNAATIVHADADLESAARWLTWGAFGNAGQSCNSAQRILVHHEVLARFTELYLKRVAMLKIGDPLDPETEVGAMVNEEAAARIEALVQGAVAAGARTIVGGRRDGALHVPTVVTGTPPEHELACTEAFGPVVLLDPYWDLDAAIEAANSTPYGLVGSVFTSSIAVAAKVASRFRVGVLNVNRPSNYRLDHLPYGGVKSSGVGREGPRWAMEEMMERRLVLIDPADDAAR